MTEKEKFILPIMILHRLSENNKPIGTDALINLLDTDDTEYIMETIGDLEKEGYIQRKNGMVELIGNRVVSRW